MRPWKMDRCQWSAKRQKFMHGRFPHCVKVIERSEFEYDFGYDYDISSNSANSTDSTAADQQVIDDEYDETIDEDISVVVDDTLEGKLGANHFTRLY